jgi:hypothetical protein
VRALALAPAPAAPYCCLAATLDAPAELCLVPAEVRFVDEGDAPKPPDTFVVDAVLPLADGRAVMLDAPGACFVVREAVIDDACAPPRFALDQSPLSPRW